MSQVVSYVRRGAVGVILVANPPVNALSHAVRQGLLEALAAGLGDPEASALVLAGDGRTFMAGADISEFGKPMAEPGLDAVIAAYESAPKPVVAAIHGTALGGGLELALGCNYRVAIAAAKVGLPEVKLGILPGAGGTQRLPRLVGAKAALDMIVAGNPVAAEDAQALGIVDAVVPGGGLAELLDGAVAFAGKLDPTMPHPRVRDREDRIAQDRQSPAIFAEARAALEKTARGLYAPFRCVDAVAAAVELPFADGLKRERALFVDCLSSPQSKALIHVFFAERQVAKIPDIAPTTASRPVARVGVIGAGTMGGGIAMNFANAGIPVTLVETTQAALDRGLGIIARNYAGTVAKGRLTQAEMDRRLALISPALEMEALAGVDLVVEAVFEEMGLKEEIFRKLDAVVKPGAVLASNTSTLDIDRIAAATSRPQDVVGMHFFSPANVMRLLEVVRGPRTAPDATVTAMQIGRKIGKVSVLVGNCDGFVGNRMLAPYFYQAEALLEEGATPQQVDRAIEAWGFAMGPFRMGDLAGIDVTWRIRQRRKAEGKPAGSALTDRLHIMDRYGQKTGAGWYRYEQGARTPLPDPAVETMLANHREIHGIQPREIADAEIVKRLLYALVNEGAKCLEDGVALRASDIDIIYLNGYGFPAWRGGPMFADDAAGLATVLADIRSFADRSPDLWRPAPLLEQLVAEGRSFADWDRGR